VVVEPPAVGERGEAAVLGPLDLGREVARRPEAEGSRQTVPDLPEQHGFRRKHVTGSSVSEGAKLRQRSRVERPCLDPIDAQRLEPRPHLPCRLVREGDGENLPRLEGAACDLVRNPARDRGRLSGARARQDAHRPPNRLDGPALLGVQPRKDAFGVHCLTLESGSADAPGSARCLREVGTAKVAVGRSRTQELVRSRRKGR